MSNIVEIKKVRNDGAIALMNKIIAGLEVGEITGVSVVIENSDGTYRLEGSETFSRLQTVGILMDLAVKRLE